MQRIILNNFFGRSNGAVVGENHCRTNKVNTANTELSHKRIVIWHCSWMTAVKRHLLGQTLSIVPATTAKAVTPGGWICKIIIKKTCIYLNEQNYIRITILLEKS